MKAARVWGWGDRFEDVRGNCEKYIDKTWKETIKECSIEITARERDEGIRYYIAAYTSNKKIVGELAEGLFYAALDEEDSKIVFVTIKLFDEMLSEKREARKPIEKVENEFKECEKIVAHKFIDDPRVKPLAQGRKVVFIPKVDLSCELESEIANKIIVRAIYEDFHPARSLLCSLSNRMINRGLAKRVMGYKLNKNVDDFQIGDIDVWEDEVTVWLI
ncbi:MAG: hypothetical protein QXO76_11840 [Thermoproteota archaeon]